VIKIEFNQELFEKHISAISKKLQTKIVSLLIDNMITEDETKECLRYLSNEKELKNLLSLNTQQLQVYIEFFKQEFPESIGVENQKEKEWSELYRVLRDELFENEYNNWGQRTREYGAYEFVTMLDLKSCPYCNRNYTFTVVNANGRMRPEIDHFYPKSKYPFLAMSFFNLIPSCPNCNHTKKDKLNSILSPYDIKEDDFSFTYKPTKVDFTNLAIQKYNFDSFESELKGKKENIELFKLQELYKQHKDIVVELLIKKAYYPQTYIDELENSFGFSKDEVYRYLVGNYIQENDLHKRPLSKLTKDIAKELELL
jgi:hypothetical protein